MTTCQQCGKQYDPKETKRVYGDTWWKNTVCSAQCYTARVMAAVRKDQSYYHKRIDDVIVDLNRFINPDLCIVDARIGVEGWNGPRTKEIGCFIIGKKPVSVDSTLAKVMGFEPKQISHIIEASKYDLGILHPDVVGLDIDSLRTEFHEPS